MTRPESDESLPPKPVGRARLRDLRVIRYAQDGGFSPREWARAIEAAGIEARAGLPVRVGVQITKARAVDVMIRVERVEGLMSRVKAALGRSESERMFGSRSARSRAGMGRALAVLTAEDNGVPARVLVCAPP